MNVALHNNIDAFRIGKLCFSVGLEPQPITLIFASIEGISITPTVSTIAAKVL